MVAPAAKSIRLRTCIATRQILPARKLLRVARDPANTGVVVPDPRAVIPGRGAWITPTREAYEKAMLKRAFNRAFRVPGQLDTAPLADYLGAASEETRRNGKDRH